MQLVGVLVSPFVRRVAVSLQLLGLPFKHRPLSVFRDLEQMGGINPVLKVPVLVCDDGCALTDSSLILDYAQALAGRSLLPADAVARRDALQLVGLGLAACEKTVAIHYERSKRPPEKLHPPWLDRLAMQLRAACDALEGAVMKQPPALDTQAGVTIAVAWFFAQAMVADVVDAAKHPSLAALSAEAERLPAFIAAAHGDGTYPVAA